jgi:hypothetical protein
MTKDRYLGTGGKAAIAGAIGSAAIAAALLYVNRRKERDRRPPTAATPLSGEQPETD